VYGWMDSRAVTVRSLALLGRLVASGKRTVGYMYCTAAPSVATALAGDLFDGGVTVGTERPAIFFLYLG
jgi:hypothetical protein